MPDNLFPLGQIVGTPAALDAMEQYQANPAHYLRRHVQGDWGNLDKRDKHANDVAVTGETRIMSSYDISVNPKVTIWIITEWDRSVTTILLPSDY